MNSNIVWSIVTGYLKRSPKKKRFKQGKRAVKLWNWSDASQSKLSCVETKQKRKASHDQTRERQLKIESNIQTRIGTNLLGNSTIKSLWIKKKTKKRINMKNSSISEPSFRKKNRSMIKTKGKIAIKLMNKKIKIKKKPML